MTHYDVYILGTQGNANSNAKGINDAGVVVGSTLDSEEQNRMTAWWTPDPSSGLTPEFRFTLGTVAGELTKVDSIGDVITNASVPSSALFNIPFGNDIATLPFTDAPALNNKLEVAGGNMIYNWQTKVPLTIPSPGSDTPVATGMNNVGDVVGQLGQSGPHGFFYSASTKATSDVGVIQLADINDNETAVGFLLGSNYARSPVYIELSQLAPQPQLIPLPDSPDLMAVSRFKTAANAINSEGTIVGTVVGIAYGTFPFVFQDRERPAVDLNTLVLNSPGWTLVDASDINDAGYIVGTAMGPGGETNERAYIAIPRIPLHGTLPLLGLIGAILRDLIPLFSRRSSGNPVTSRLPAVRSGLPTDQGETLLTSAISNLAGLMSDPEARSQIQSISAEVASRASPKANGPPRQLSTKPRRSKSQERGGARPRR